MRVRMIESVILKESFYNYYHHIYGVVDINHQSSE